jgi:ParB/Sulfiredoxin domain
MSTGAFAGTRDDLSAWLANISADQVRPATYQPVRPVNGAYEIIAGWHRWTAAGHVKPGEIPCWCWVKTVDDNEAFLKLVCGNA